MKHEIRNVMLTFMLIGIVTYGTMQFNHSQVTKLAQAEEKSEMALAQSQLQLNKIKAEKIEALRAQSIKLVQESAAATLAEEHKKTEEPKAPVKEVVTAVTKTPIDTQAADAARAAAVAAEQAAQEAKRKAAQQAAELAAQQAQAELAALQAAEQKAQELAAAEAAAKKSARRSRAS